MVRFQQVEKVQERVAGEYLFKIYEVNEKTSQAGNEYWQVKFETADGFKVCDNFMFSGKAANKTLGLLYGLGIGDGEAQQYPLRLLVDDLRSEHYLSLFGELDGIAHQIEQDLAQALAIAAYHRWNLFGIELEAKMLGVHPV